MIRPIWRDLKRAPTPEQLEAYLSALETMANVAENLLGEHLSRKWEPSWRTAQEEWTRAETVIKLGIPIP